MKLRSSGKRIFAVCSSFLPAYPLVAQDNSVLGLAETYASWFCRFRNGAHARQKCCQYHDG